MEKHEHPAKVLLDGSGFIGVRFVLLVLSDLERGGCTMRLEETRILEDSVSALHDSICQHVKYSLGKECHNLSGHDLFLAMALAVRDRLVDRMLETEERYQRADVKRLYYLIHGVSHGKILGK
jgi:hypothetical protein